MGIILTGNRMTPGVRMPCSKRMAACPMSCLHRQAVEEYRAARRAEELRREYETVGYKAEMAEYGPIIHYRVWLEKGRAA